jgi:hypothetical protein
MSANNEVNRKRNRHNSEPTSADKSPSEKSPEVKRATMSVPNEVQGMLNKHLKSMEELLNKTAAELKRDFGAQMNALREENTRLVDRVSYLEYENNRFESMLDDLGNRSRRENVIIAGIPEGRNESPDQLRTKVTGFCCEKLGMGTINFTGRLHRLGFKPPAGKDRLVIVQVQEDTCLQQMFRNTDRLRGTGAFIQRDYTFLTRKKRSALNIVRKVLVEKKIKAKLQVDFLMVNGVRFDVDRHGNLLCGRECGIRVLDERFKVRVDIAWNRAKARFLNNGQEGNQAEGNHME